MVIKKKRVPSILYHYTSVGTLLKIFENSETDKICLRATNAKFFNDPHEYNLAVSLLITSMISYEKEKSIENKISQNIKNRVLNRLSTMPGNPFILSLSENSDNLIMWRTYGFDGKGVAIGLDKKMLDDYSKDERNKNVNLHKCIYDKNLILNGLINYWGYYYDTITIKKDENSIGFDSFRFLFDVVDFSFQFKRSEYETEKEWRLCKNEMDDNNYKFIERDGVIIPFVEHYFPKEIIKKIIIGPCVNKQLIKDSIITFLKSRKFRLPTKSIIASKVPYRKI